MCCALAIGARAQQNIVVVYPPQPPPAVTVIMRARPPVEPVEYPPVQPTKYLIAFKNSEVRVADQYWVSGKTLFFLTADHQRLSAPLDSVDRPLSRQLNSELNVAFYLPARPATTQATTHLVHKTVSVVHKRCYCGPSSASTLSKTRGTASRSER
jgi:hypothetical protein